MMVVRLPEQLHLEQVISTPQFVGFTETETSDLQGIWNPQNTIMASSLPMTSSMQNFSSVARNQNLIESNFTVSPEVILQTLNTSKFERLLPAVVYTTILMVIGTPGNFLVWIIYFTRWRKSSTRIFILALATLDLINCLLTLPVEIFMLFNYLIFDYSVVCKISRFTTYTCNGAAALILIAIAGDRYQRICKPHNKTMTIGTAKVICLAIMALTFATTWPSLVIYGTQTFSVAGYPNVKIKVCLIEDEFVKTKYPLAFFVFNCICTLNNFAILSILYILVGISVCKRWRFKTSVRAVSSCNAIDESVNNNELVRRLTVTGSRHNSLERSTTTHTNESSSPRRSDQGLKELSRINSIGMSKLAVNGTGDPILKTKSSGLLEVPVIGMNMSRLHDNNTGTSKLPANNIEMSRLNVNDTYSTKLPVNNIEMSRLNVNDGMPSTQPLNDVRISKLSMNSTGISTPTLNGTPVNGAPPSPGALRRLLTSASKTIQRTRSSACDQRAKRITKTTLMLFIVTVVYCVSFLPFLGIAIHRSIHPTAWITQSSMNEMVYQVFLRSYLFNCVINPIIYSFCNELFRKECKKLFFRMFHCRRTDHSNYSNCPRK